MSQSPDLERIMSYFQKETGTAPSEYVEFPSTLPQTVHSLPAAPRRSRPLPVPPRPNPPSPLERPAPGPSQISQPITPPQNTSLANEWPALDEALGKGRTGAGIPDGPWPTILITGLSGGTGKTLLAAALATTLSLQRQPVILVDLNGTSFFPFLFIGSHKVETTRVGRVWTSYFHDGQQIPVLSVRTEGPFSGDTGQGIDPNFSDLYHEIRAEAPALFPFSKHPRPMILVDLAASGRSLFEEAIVRTKLVFFPITPEIPSLLSVKEMENYFEALETGKGIYCERFYLPNRFAGDNPFHVHLLGRFQWLLNRRLCPVVIPEDPSLESILARGEPFPNILTQNELSRTLGTILPWLVEKCSDMIRNDRAKDG